MWNYSIILVLIAAQSQVTAKAGSLERSYDFTLEVVPEGPAKDGSAPPSDPNGSKLFSAVREQLGLKLESRKGMVDCMTIEQVERPSAN